MPTFDLKKDMSGLVDGEGIKSFNVSWAEMNDSPMTSMYDGVNEMLQNPTEDEFEAGIDTNSMDAYDISSSWIFISQFPQSAAVKSKKNSEDNLMDNVVNSVEGLYVRFDALARNNRDEGLKLVSSLKENAISSIGYCDAYISKKHPLMPKGKKRKQAVIDLKKALTTIKKADDRKVFDALTINYAGNLDTMKGIEDTQEYKDRFAESFYLRKYYENLTNEYTAANKKMNADKDYGERYKRDQVKIAVHLNKESGISVDEAGPLLQTVEKYRRRGAAESGTASALRKIMDPIWKKDPEEFAIMNESDINFTNLINKCEFLEYANLIRKGPYLTAYRWMFENNESNELASKLNLFANLKKIYDLFNSVSEEVAYVRSGPVVLKLLQLQASDIRKMRNKLNKERKSGDEITEDNWGLMDHLYELKCCMENYGFEIGKPVQKKLRETK